MARSKPRQLEQFRRGKEFHLLVWEGQASSRLRLHAWHIPFGLTPCPATGCPSERAFCIVRRASEYRRDDLWPPEVRAWSCNQIIPIKP